MRTWRFLPWSFQQCCWLALLSAMTSVSCGAQDSENGFMAEPAPNNGGGDTGGTNSGIGGGGGSSNGGSGGSALPPETELENSYGAPVATGRYVWVTNPTSGRVAYIDASNYQIRIVEAGNNPSVIAAVPTVEGGDDVAIVLNTLSKDASILRAKSSGDLSSTNVDIPTQGNTWAVSPDGRWAIAWTDSTRVVGADPVDGFQDISVVDLRSGKEHSTFLTVGYRPMAFSFNEDVSEAYAVTQDGISVVALNSTPEVTNNIWLSLSVTEDATKREVVITPNGATAIVRRFDSSTVQVVSLSDSSSVDVELPAMVTDVDVSTSGDLALAVLRSTNQVALLPLPDVANDPTDFQLVDVPDGTIGSASLAPQSPTAFLYTNAVADPILHVLPLDSDNPTPKAILLRAPILSVFPTPDASHAIVLHNGPPTGSTTTYPASLSVVPIAKSLPARIQGLEATPISVAIAPDGKKALVAATNQLSGVHRLYVATMPSLQVAEIELASPPIAAGIVAGAKKGFVSQQNADGRITFVDLETGETRTLTGFELAAQVVTSSNP